MPSFHIHIDLPIYRWSNRDVRRDFMVSVRSKVLSPPGNINPLLATVTMMRKKCLYHVRLDMSVCVPVLPVCMPEISCQVM